MSIVASTPEAARAELDRRLLRTSRRSARWRRMTLAVGLGLIGFVIVASVIGHFVYPNPNEQNLAEALQAPSSSHPFGTDNLGRDVLARTLAATWVDLAVALVATYIAIGLGVVIGTVAGYVRGWPERLIMRVVDVIIAFPFMVLAIAIVAIMGPGLKGVFVVLVLLGWALYARLARAEMLVLREKSFIQAAQTLGYSHWRVILAPCDPEPDPAEPRVLDVGHRVQHPRDLGTDVPGAGRAAADAGVGRDHRRRADVPADGVVDHDAAGDRGRDRRDGVQPRRGRLGGSPARATSGRSMTGMRVSPDQTPDPAAAAATPLLRVSGLTVGFPAAEQVALAVDGVGFEAFPGETLGIVGESGCGKSMSLRALLGIVPAPGTVLAGEVAWEGEVDLLREPERMRAMRGREISMVFQDPMESLDPVYSIGDQLTEVLRRRAGHSRTAARTRAVELLDRVGIPSAAQRLRSYPHELSGGMRQRVMIAIAIACGPRLLLADEPTTALDVTIQDQILSLLAELQRETRLTILLVSHDLGVIAQMADRIAVMYAGHVVETGSADEVLDAPRHPYTAALIASAPDATGAVQGTRLETIGGSPPTITELPAGCVFQPRCRHARPACGEVEMTLDRGPGEHASACPMVDASGRREGSGSDGG